MFSNLFFYVKTSVKVRSFYDFFRSSTMSSGAVSPLFATAFKTGKIVADNLDVCLQTLGVKMCPMSVAEILQGLPEEAVAELVDPEFGKPFQAVLKGLRRNSDLTLLNRYGEITNLRLHLEARIGVKKAIARNPAILDVPIRKPMYLIGFPRTGTTLLYNLMALDEQFTAPMFYEIMTPFPEGRRDNFREEERFKKAAYFLELRKLAGASQFDSAHLMRAEMPEECLFILSHCLFAYWYHVRLDTCTELEEWFYNLTKEETDAIYRMYKKVLQVIGFGQMENKTYLLKAHIHLMCLDSLLEVCPDACMVFTYRGLREMMGSFCSMIEKATELYGAPIDAQYGRRVLKLLSTFANRSVKVMQQYDAQDPEVLTPNSLLQMTGEVQLPLGIFNSDDRYHRQKWKQIQFMMEEFWRRFTKEYLQNLQVRRKWQQAKENLAVGDLVLLVEKNLPRNRWMMGRVLEVPIRI